MTDKIQNDKYHRLKRQKSSPKENQAEFTVRGDIVAPPLISSRTNRGRQIEKPSLVVHRKKSKFDVYIGRPSKWGNPFKIGPDGTREQVIQKYRKWLVEERPDLVAAAKRELKGKVLGCWCAPSPCHGDVLAEIANGK